MNAKKESILMKIYNFTDRRIDRIDLVFMILVFAVCYFCFVQGDLMITGNNSFLMQTNPLSFYDKCYEWSGIYAANYLPSTFILFAIWTLPLRIIGHVPADMFSNSIINNMWYKLLPIIFVVLTAVVIEKICIQMGMGDTKSKLAKYAFLMAPLTLFCTGIFSQYDIFTVFFIILGYYFYIKGNRYKFILFFALAITFKYQALLYFAVLLVLKEKSILKIIRDVILVAVPTLIEMAIYYPSSAFRQSVLKFGALSYLDNSLNLGGLRPINVFLLVMIILMVFAYLCKPKEDDFVQWTLFFANGISFAFYGLVYFHPQWLLLCVPFMVLTIMRTNYSKILLVIQNILIVALYFLVVNIWTGNVDQEMINYGVLKNTISGSFALKMKDILSYDNEVYLFTVIFAILLIYFIISHPKFAQNNVKVIEKDTALNIRIAFIVAFAAWSIPAFMCYKNAADGNYMLYDDQYSDQDVPIAVFNGVELEQEFNNNAERINSFKVRVGNYGYGADKMLNIAFIDADTDKIVYKNEKLIKAEQTDGWLELLAEPLTLEQGNYYLRITGMEDESNPLGIFRNNISDELKELTVDDELQSGSLVIQVTGSYE